MNFRLTTGLPAAGMSWYIGSTFPILRAAHDEVQEMDKDLTDRAKAIQQRIVQLKDSL